MSCRYGAPGASSSRPYGNSSVLADIADAIGYRQCGEDEWYSREEERYLENLHREMHLVVQIILHTGQMKPGIYKKPGLSEDWVAIEYPASEPELVLASSEDDVPLPQADLRRILAELIRQVQEEDGSNAQLRWFANNAIREAIRDIGIHSENEGISSSRSWLITALINDLLGKER